MKINRIIDMKSTVISKPIILLFMGSLLFMGCSSRTSIRAKQANQILDMIIYEQSKEDFSRGNEISVSYKETVDDSKTTKYIYELSEKNNVVHIYDLDKVATETWYYLESGVLYSATREDDGSIFTAVVSNDPEAATASFSRFFVDYKLIATKKISEVDKPSEIKEFITSLDEIDEHKLKTRFQTKKDYNLTADIKVYEDIFKKNKIKEMKFEFNDSKLLSYSYQEKGGSLSEYNISYTKSVSRDSIR